MRRAIFLLLCFATVAANAAQWRRYSEHGCIGGEQCRQNGKRITIALEDAPVIGVRFFAHDNIGQRADGKLNVRVDNHSVASFVDIQRNGRVHEFDVDRVRGDKLVIETASDDEVEVRDIEVLYGPRDDGRDREYDRDRGRDSDHRDYDRDRREERWEREYGEEGGCIGGSECGGHRARIRIPLRDQRIRSITFYADDNVGRRHGGKLRVTIDGEVLRDYMDVHQNGRDYDIDGHGVRGRWLLFEPASDDEVVIRRIRVHYERY
jgi:hypothetical protein